MAKQEDLHQTALAALRSEKRIGPHFKPEALTIDADGVATIESRGGDRSPSSGLPLSVSPAFPASAASSTGCG